MWIKKKEIEQLSEFVKGYSSGEELDIRVNKEGSFNILKNDIYALVNTKNEQIKAVETERDSLSDYMADISHQLKTPITSMMIMADLLEEAEPEKQTEFIHNIQISLNKMEWLVGALLKMAKLDAHAVEFIRNDIHTSELLEAVKPSVAILLDIHNLTIELKQDCIIHCDKRWTTEALTNIVKNAIEYSPDGSVIEIVKTEYLVTGNEAAALAEQVKETVAKVTTTTLYVREEPNTDCSIVTSMPMGEELEVVEQLDGWVKVSIDSDEGYVSADYIEINTELPTAMTMTEVRYGQGVSDVRVDLVSYACQFVGNPYVWGGTSLTRGADCSGFVMSVFANYGVSLPHSSGSQAGCGTSISASEAQPGDLFFYGNGSRINHVAIYIGNGQVVHASSPRTGIKISGAYYRNPVKVVRVLQD